MASGIKMGVNFTLEGNSIQFFDNKGMILDGGYAINALGGDLMVAAHAGTPVLPGIIDLIKQDEAAGNSDELAMVLTVPITAVAMFLEGAIPAELLNSAIEGADTIDIPNVPFGERELTLRIVNGGEHRLATANSDGVVI